MEPASVAISRFLCSAAGVATDCATGNQVGGNTARAVAGKLRKRAISIDQVNTRGMAFLLAQPLDAIGPDPVVAIAQGARQPRGVDSLELFTNDEKIVAVGAGLDEGNAGDLWQC